MNQPVGIAYHETITFCEVPISITFSKILEDSRCPENVVCIWQGLAELEVLIEVDGKEEAYLLSTYPSFRNIPSEVQVDGYRFSLKNVSPYPNTTKSYQEKDYNIQLLVEKVNE
ncbi:hypothetical protein JYB62_11305 [Algoriphagus lutimaris]|uniref:hypothetical protein n=1 Tax=Algoriphagus lutimaris TaxID=613197 RepID=UPI00196A2A7D|nr:hypothetical protein [Algoriphagus lutimaris]MBN3520584.1 hypothetical protein [Algoriphagus lutimaris]